MIGVIKIGQNSIKMTKNGVFLCFIKPQPNRRIRGKTGQKHVKLASKLSHLLTSK